MFGYFFFILKALQLLASLEDCNTKVHENYFEFPHFWTNVGLCPAGEVNHKDITNSLNSDAMLINLKLISALPTGAVTHIRIHWLLELLEFVQFTQEGFPIYQFDMLDQFMNELDSLGLYPVVEFMGNPGYVFEKNPNYNILYWEDLAYQVTRRYLNMYGAGKLLQWKFETWNEPDLPTYNKLNFTEEAYLSYVAALRYGLTQAGCRGTTCLKFSLRGPAGLFKDPEKHPLCWVLLKYCASMDLKFCPVDVLTYHRKGNGRAVNVINESSELLQYIHRKFPNLTAMPVSNDEADATSGWSTPLNSQADVHYAHTLVRIVMEHWDAKLKNKEFKQLETISHDNAFLSYHPYEFTQRTLLAQFRMNETTPKYSQFIQKPVYTALGMLSKLGTTATHIANLHTTDGDDYKVLKSITETSTSSYYSWFVVSEEHERNFQTNFIIPFKPKCLLDEPLTYAAELLEQKITDPYHVWLSFGKPAYPNATVRDAMRRRQAPVLHMGQLVNGELSLEMKDINKPWILLLRFCRQSWPKLKQPQKLDFTEVTQGEVLLTWREILNTTQCLQSYEVWYSQYNKEEEWQLITADWHIPFPNFHYAPINGKVSGFYKVRGIDLFNRTSPFSDAVEYYEI